MGNTPPPSDTVLSLHVHAGVDYRLSERMPVGLKLTSNWMDDIRQRDAYTYHPVPGMTSHSTISGSAASRSTTGPCYSASNTRCKAVAVLRPDGAAF